MTNDPSTVESVEIRVKYSDGSSVELLGGAARNATLEEKHGEYQYADHFLFNTLKSYTFTVNDPLMDSNQRYFTVYSHSPKEL